MLRRIGSDSAANSPSRLPSPGEVTCGAAFNNAACRYSIRLRAELGAGYARLPGSRRARFGWYFDDVPFQAARGLDDVVLLAYSHPERIERGADMAQRKVPFLVGNT